jgi:MFS superfamily sulfate permease-like transporter
LLAAALLLAPVIAQVPLAALAGVLVVPSVRMNQPRQQQSRLSREIAAQT